jgi:hypothetical protein
MRDALSRVLGVLRQRQRLGSAERSVGAHLADLGARNTLQRSLLGGGGLDGLRLSLSDTSSGCDSTVPNKSV